MRPTEATLTFALLDARFLCLALVVAFYACYLGLGCVQRMRRARNTPRALWLLGCAITLGLAPWVMSVWGVQDNTQVWSPAFYDDTTALLSFLIAVTATAVAIFVARRPVSTRVSEGVSSVLLASGIVAVQYLGIAAFRSLAATLAHLLPLFLSTLTAWLGAWGALSVITHQHRLHETPARALGASVLVVSLALTHFLVLGAFELHLRPAGMIATSPSLLSVGVLGATMLVTLIVTLSALRLDQEAGDQEAALHASQEHLHAVVGYRPFFFLPSTSRDAIR